MTASVNSIPFVIRDQEARLKAKAPAADDPPLDLDAQARRVAAGVARGDESAFTELYDRYQGRLFRLAMALGHGDETLAAETVHSAFLTAASKLRRIESERHLWNWLASVARQHLAKTWHRQKREATFISMGDIPDVANASQSDDALEQKLDTALLSLQAADRQLIEWRYFDGLCHQDIANRTGGTAKAVASKLERARVKLRALLARKDP
jgi:RNA polymerase sigma-70 factor (ECF subfamily)